MKRLTNHTLHYCRVAVAPLFLYILGFTLYAINQDSIPFYGLYFKTDTLSWAMMLAFSFAILLLYWGFFCIVDLTMDDHSESEYDRELYRTSNKISKWHIIYMVLLVCVAIWYLVEGVNSQIMFTASLLNLCGTIIYIYNTITNTYLS